MNRRSLFRKLGVVAAAVAVAPAVQVAGAEARSDLWFSDAAIEHGDGPSGWSVDDQGVRHYLVDGVHQQSCCPTPLTFEAMQADCSAHGCWVSIASDTHWLHATFSALEPSPSRTVTNLEILITPDIARVDAWRRDLHIAACPVCSPPDEARPTSRRADQLCASCQNDIRSHDAFAYASERARMATDA